MEQVISLDNMSRVQNRLKDYQRQQILAERKHRRHKRKERGQERAVQISIKRGEDRYMEGKEDRQKILQNITGDINTLNADQAAASKAEELQRKLQSQEKRVDYFERAKRLEEIPHLQANMQERQMQDQTFWEQQETESVAAAIEERRLVVANREHLSRMKPEKDVFLEKLLKERNIVYEDKLKEFEMLLAEEKHKRLLERRAIRKEERRSKYLKEKEEEEERKRAEEKQREEEERACLEEVARREKEAQERIKREEIEKRETEKQEMLDRVAAKQRQKEEEVERKLLIEDKSKQSVFIMEKEDRST